METLLSLSTVIQIDQRIYFAQTALELYFKYFALFR